MSKFLVLLLTFLVLGAQAALPPTRSGEASGSLSTQFNWIYQDNHLTSLGGISKMVESDSLRLLNNQSFESPTAGEGWTYVPSGADVLTADLADKIDGARSLEITPAAESFTLTQTAAIDQLAGSIIGFKVWVKADVPVQACFMRDATQSGCESYSGGGQWQEIFLYGNVVSGEAAGVQIGSVGSVTGTVKVDALRTIANPLEPTDIYASSEWVNSGPSVITGSSVNPTKGATARDNVYWRRVGDSMEVRFEYYQTSAGSSGSGEYYLQIPDGYQIDLSKVNGSGVNDISSVVGNFHISNTASGIGDTSRHGIIKAVDSGRVGFMPKNTNSETFTPWGSSAFGIGGAPIKVNASFTVPIQGWSNTSQGVVVKNRTDSSSVENVFSAKISTAGTVTSENVDWIDGNATITGGASQLGSFNLVSGLFSGTPNCNCTIRRAGVGADVCELDSTSSTQINYSMTSGGGALNAAIDIVCTRGTDYIKETDKVNTVPIGFKESESYKSQFVANFWDSSGAGQLWDTSLIGDTSGSNTIEIVDNFVTPAGLNSTIIRAKQPIDISITVSGDVVAGGGLVIYDQDATGTANFLAWSGNFGQRNYSSVSYTTKLKAGEYLYARNNGVNRDGAIGIWAKPSKEEGLWLGTFGQPTCIIQNRATAVAASPAASVTTLDLTDIQGNCSFVSLSSNEFTLEKGTYEIYARSMNYNNNSNQMYITDTSNNIQEGCVSDNGDAVAGTGDTGNMSLDCFLSLSSSATFRQRQFSQTASTEGLCRATHNETGNPATYTVCNRVKITKVR